MDNTASPSSSKQYVISNPLRATKKATRLTVLLDDELCLRKLVRTEELDKGAEIILEPRKAGGMSIMGAARVSLIDLEIPGAIGPLDDDSWGINIAAAQTNFPLQGLQLYLQPWSAMAIGDSYQIMLNGTTQVASGAITQPGDVGARGVAFVPSVRLTPGAHTLSYVIRRLGQQPEISDELPIFVKLDAPGGVDEDGSKPGHSELKFSLPEDIERGGVDKDAAAEGVIATVSPYPNMAAGDDIKLSWGGWFVHHVPVTEAEVGKDIRITVDEATILAAGDSDAEGLAVTFEVYDRVFNRSSDWSAEKRIVVDTGNSRLDAPFVIEVIDGVLDLDLIGTAPATMQIVVRGSAFTVGDSLVAYVTGTTADGDLAQYEAPPVEIDRLNKIFEIEVPNAFLRRLAQAQASFTYRLDHQDSSFLSRGQFANIIGHAAGMTAPIARDAEQGALDPALTRTAIEIPWDESMAAGDQITLRWIGTRPDLTVYDPVLPPDPITGREEANKLPIVINIDGTHLKPLEGGTLQLYFELAKDVGGDIVVRESARAVLLNVGEPQAELPAPIVDGVTDDVIDPALPGTQLTVPRYPAMEVGDEVHYLWKGSVAGEEEDWIKINSFTKDKDVVFAIDRAFIADNDKGSVEVSYWVIRADGRRSDSDILGFRVGTEALDPPTISSIKDSKGVEIPANTTTFETSVEVAGKASPNQTVDVLDGASSKGKPKANANGDWTLDITGLNVAIHDIKAVAQYGENPESAVRSFTVTVATAPTIESIKDFKGVEIPANTTTFETSVKIAGNASPNQVVDVLDGSNSKGRSTVNASGDWTLDITGLNVAAHDIKAVAQYGENPESAVRSFTVTTAIAPTINSIKDSKGVEIPPNTTTFDTGVKVAGKASPNETVEVFDGSTSEGKPQANASGEWTLDITGLSDGAHAIKAVAQYGSNPVSDEHRFTVAAGVTPTIDRINDSVGEDIPEGGTTSDHRLVLIGTALPGGTVEVFKNDSLFSSAKADDTGVWRMDMSVNSTPHRLKAVAAYGNRPESQQRSFSVDPGWARVLDLKDFQGKTVAPLATISNPNVTFSGTTIPRRYIHLTINRDERALADANGNWTLRTTIRETGFHAVGAVMIEGDPLGGSTSNRQFYYQP